MNDIHKTAQASGQWNSKGPWLNQWLFGDNGPDSRCRWYYVDDLPVPLVVEWDNETGRGISYVNRQSTPADIRWCGSMSWAGMALHTGPDAPLRHCNPAQHADQRTMFAATLLAPTWRIWQEAEKLGLVNGEYDPLPPGVMDTFSAHVAKKFWIPLGHAHGIVFALRTANAYYSIIDPIEAAAAS